MDDVANKESGPHLNSITGGFTLIELLVVMGIIGIMIGVLAYYSFVWVQTSRLREAAQQVVTDLQRARSQAQLTSWNSELSLCATIASNCVSTAGNTSYLRRWGIGGTGPGTGQATLPYNIMLTNVQTSPGSGYIKYSAPYAETDATGLIWKVTSPSSAVKPLYIKVVSITGKVVLSATN